MVCFGSDVWCEHGLRRTYGGIELENRWRELQQTRTRSHPYDRATDVKHLTLRSLNDGMLAAGKDAPGWLKVVPLRVPSQADLEGKQVHFLQPRNGLGTNGFLREPRAAEKIRRKSHILTAKTRLRK